MLQELGVHELGSSLPLHQQHRFYHVVVRKETQRRGFFSQTPNADALVIRTADEGLSVAGQGKTAYPALVTSEGALAVAGGNLP